MSQGPTARSKEYDVVVIGGGPAGSTVASFLSQWGRRVLLLEKESFPRHHVGESLLPGTLAIMKRLGVLEKVRHAGFVPKFGATYVWGKSRKPWSVNFIELSENMRARGGLIDHSFQVDRAKFDKILLDHCKESGATVLEGCRATGVDRDEQQITRVSYLDQAGNPRVASCQICVDATGQNCFLGNSLDLREFNESLRNIALYGYFQGGRPLDHLVPNPDPKHNGNIFVAATESGWIWYIPLGGGRYSVGLVTDGSSSREINRVGRYRFYRHSLDTTQEIAFLLGDAEIESESLHTLSDWSYICRQFHGPGYLLVGDAAAFIDPILSTGVHLAMNGALGAAVAINTSLSDSDLTGHAMQWYEEEYKAIASKFLQLAEHWYLGHRSQKEWFSTAQRLVDPASNLSVRQAFVYLAGGYESDLMPLAGFHSSQLKTMYENFDSALPTDARKSVVAPRDDRSNQALWEAYENLEESRPRLASGVSYRQFVGVHYVTDNKLTPRIQIDRAPAEGVTWQRHSLPMATLPLLKMIDGNRTVREIAEELTGGNGVGGAQIFREVRKLYDDGIITPVQSRPLQAHRKPQAERAGRLATLRRAGRNDPCPCGSGRKYKRCHGR